MTLPGDDLIPCPACGGAGGGPFGRRGSAWDDEEYVCPRCEGAGMVKVRDASLARPGIAKAQPSAETEAPAKPGRKVAG